MSYTETIFPHITKKAVVDVLVHRKNKNANIFSVCTVFECHSWLQISDDSVLHMESHF